MQLRLTYAGPIYSEQSETGKRLNQKHVLRKHFHRQLKRLWAIHPILKNTKRFNMDRGDYDIIDDLSKRFSLNNFNFVPLVIGDRNAPSCSVHVLMLRKEAPGQIIKSGDIDRRLTIIFDALMIPPVGQLQADLEPEQDEKPFYCLLESDSLITQIAVDTDTLLEAVDNAWDDNTFRLLVTIELSPPFLHTPQF